METLNVVLKLNEIICHDEGDGWGSAEPYLWVVFFKIDGQSVWQNGVMLAGEADFRFSHGSHNNLPNHDVDPGEVVPIPSNVGEWSTILSPIKLDFFGNQLEIPGIVGMVAVLMEEDNVSDDGAEAGHRALNDHVRSSINAFISDINLLDFIGVDDPMAELQKKIDALIDSIKDGISDVVKDAITSNQNWLEDFWAWLNPDDKIGDKVWTFSASDLIENNYNIDLNHRWENEGDWEINGEVSASELCPANAMNSHSVRSLGQKLSLAKLRTFRGHVYKEYPQATDWWKLVLRNSPFIIRELQKDKNLTRDVFQMITMVESSIEKEEKLDEAFFVKAGCVLDVFSKSHFKSLKMDSRRVKPVLEDLKGKSLKEVLGHLSSCKPLVQVKG